jgi:acyl carrier protein
MTDYLTPLRAFIVDNFLLGATSTPLRDTDSLIERQVVDSTGFLELVGFLEERFGIVVEDEEMIPENLDSLQALAAYVGRKCPA